jgi:hypothetical protein
MPERNFILDKKSILWKNFKALSFVDNKGIVCDHIYITDNNNNYYYYYLSPLFEIFTIIRVYPKQTMSCCSYSVATIYGTCNAFPMLTVLHFYITSIRSMRAVPNMAVF